VSVFLGIHSSGVYGVITLYTVMYNDETVQPSYYKIAPPLMSGVANTLRDSDILWPRSSFTGQTDTANCAPIWDSTHQAWEWNFPATGAHVRKKISGVTKDSTGAVLGSATVQIFNTATGLLVDTVTSDSAGNYFASDPNAVNCFAVAYEAGSPDVAGTTKNNLTGT